MNAAVEHIDLEVAVVGAADPAELIRAWCQDAEANLTEPGKAEIVVLAPDADPAAIGPTRPDAVIAVCTTGEAVTPRIAALPDPAAGAGLHIVSGYSHLTLVEIVAAEPSASATIDAIGALVARLGLTAVPTKDRPGFLVERLVFPYLNQAVDALDDGIASAADIDRSVELGLGYPVGPLRLLDELGLDIHHASTTAIAAELPDPQFRPPPLLTRKVQAGTIGRRRGRGFFDYQETT
jgi:3-hydroxybutyryl-CoA dehydrogenase